MDTFYLQWVDRLLVVLGVSPRDLNDRLYGWGFVFLLASNVCWIGFGVMTETSDPIFMQVVFTATSLLGIHHWILVMPDFRARKEVG